MRIRTPRRREGRQSAPWRCYDGGGATYERTDHERGAARRGAIRRKRFNVNRPQVYYEKKAKRKVQQRAAEAPQSQWDDEHHDYKLEMEDAFGEHYTIKERIGKGSFGQVVRARDERTGTDVAIKIIKSKKPFALQAQTEIELLRALRSADRDDKQNIVRLLDHFVYRGHECLVFEMLSYNLYELLKNTQFHGVSLNLVRKFAKQILHALAFLARPVRTRRLFPNISELHVASTASSRCRAASTPSS